jgi:hypothetical protein
MQIGLFSDEDYDWPGIIEKRKTGVKKGVTEAGA